MAYRRISAFSLISASCLLAACGGGGGGDGGSPAPGTGSGSAGTLALTEAHAKPAAAHALDVVLHAGASEGPLGLVTGVQLQSAAGPTGLPTFTQLAVSALQGRLVPLVAAPKLATGIAISDYRESCPQGGSAVLSGNVASEEGLTPGDSITLELQNCRTVTGGSVVLMNGRFTLRLDSGNMNALPASGVFNISMTELSVQEGAVTRVVSGDQRVDLTMNSAASFRLNATGNAFSMRVVRGGTSRTTTLQNYAQGLVVNGASTTASLTALVQTDHPRWGGAGSYALTTPTPLTVQAQTGAVSAGTIRLLGAANSQVLATFGAGSTASLQVDANGDGAFERTLPSSQAELSSSL